MQHAYGLYPPIYDIFKTDWPRPFMRTKLEDFETIIVLYNDRPRLVVGTVPPFLDVAQAATLLHDDMQ